MDVTDDEILERLFMRSTWNAHRSSQAPWTAADRARWAILGKINERQSWDKSRQEDMRRSWVRDTWQYVLPIYHAAWSTASRSSTVNAAAAAKVAHSFSESLRPVR